MLALGEEGTVRVEVGVAAKALMVRLPPDIVALSPTSAVTWTVAFDIATEAPMPTPAPPATPMAEAESCGVATA